MRRKYKDLPKLIAAVAILFVLCGGLGYIVVQGWSQISADEFGCYVDIDGPQTSIIIDVSEPRWDKTMQRALYTYMEQLNDGLRFNEQLAVYTTQIDKVASVVKPAFYVCGQASSPDELPDGAEQAQAGYLKRQKQRLYNEVFKPQLDKVLKLDIAEDQRQVYESPIFEMVRSVSRTAQSENGDRLVVVSDGIQSTESLRFCSVAGAMPSFNVLKQRSIYQTRLKPAPLDGVNVDFLFLQRHGYGTGDFAHCASEEEVISLWRDFIKDVGAIPEFIRIRSGAEQ